MQAIIVANMLTDALQIDFWIETAGESSTLIKELMSDQWILVIIRK